MWKPTNQINSFKCCTDPVSTFQPTHNSKSGIFDIQGGAFSPIHWNLVLNRILLGLAQFGSKVVSNIDDVATNLKGILQIYLIMVYGVVVCYTMTKKHNP